MNCSFFLLFKIEDFRVEAKNSASYIRGLREPKRSRKRMSEALEGTMFYKSQTVLIASSLLVRRKKKFSLWLR
jgi:hypothetical protein